MRRKNLKSNNKKLFVIGLDGATFNIIMPLVKAGKLPMFKKLLKKSASGVLKSVIPPITPCAWETAVTGVNPGRHNIFDFVSYNSDYKTDIISSRNRAALAVWDYIAEIGKKSLVFNYPMGYPPPNINGIFVSGMNTPGVNTQFTTPKKIKEEILKKISDYKIDVLGDHIVNGREDLFFEDVKKLTIKHFQAASFLLKKYEWDLALVFFTEPDRVQHYFYHDFDDQHPLNKIKKAKKNRILEYYQLLDNILEKLITSYPNIPFIIFSDHGIASLHKDIFIEKYLKEWKLLSFKKTSKGVAYARLSKFLSFLRKVAYRIGIAEKILKLLPGNLFTFIVRVSSSQDQEKGNINWNKTRVYFPTPSSQGLRVNLKGREIQGIVSSKMYERERDSVIKKLLSIKDPSNGEKMVKHVYKREEIYSGPYVENAQDLIIETHSRYHLQKGINKDKLGLASEEGILKSAEHAREGIFILFDKTIKPKSIKEMQLVDVAAYILYILGVPIPKKIEGKINKKIFTKI